MTASFLVQLWKIRFAFFRLDKTSDHVYLLSAVKTEVMKVNRHRNQASCFSIHFIFKSEKHLLKSDQEKSSHPSSTLWNSQIFPTFQTETADIYSFYFFCFHLKQLFIFPPHQFGFHQSDRSKLLAQKPHFMTSTCKMRVYKLTLTNLTI